MHVHFETFIYNKSLPKKFSAMHRPLIRKMQLASKIKSGEAPTCCTICAFVDQNSRPAATDPYVSHITVWPFGFLTKNDITLDFALL
jgi:hypothetical protein